MVRPDFTYLFRNITKMPHSKFVLYMISDLFLLAHRLVDLFPEWVISWFAVGSYYFLVGKQEHARRYLSRATQLDRVFGPSWLAYGNFTSEAL